MPALSILIVAFNSGALIRQCLEAIPAACAGFSYEILLVDNGDGTTEALVRDKFPEVRILPSRGNIGFAGGNNLLAEHSQADRLLLLNPDLIAHRGAIDALMTASQRYPEAAAWGGVTLTESGEPDAGNNIPLPSLARLIRGATGRAQIAAGPDSPFAQDSLVDVICGGFVMFRRDVWEEMGGLDQSYFLYSEEIDLFYRLASKGYRSWRIAAARGYHAVGHGDNLSPMRVLYQAAGAMHFARLHWPPPKRWAAFALMWLAAWQRYGAGLLLGWRQPHFARLRRGYRLVALRPHWWAFGYDPRKGLKARLGI